MGHCGEGCTVEVGDTASVTMRALFVFTLCGLVCKFVPLIGRRRSAQCMFRARQAPRVRRESR